MPTAGLPFVRQFIEDLQAGIKPGLSIDLSGFLMSRAGDGTLQLTGPEYRRYRDVVEQLLRQFAQDDDLSRATVEQLLKDALFSSLDLANRSSDPFPTRVSEALAALRRGLAGTPRDYRIWVAVSGMDPQDLPFRFGNIRFVRFTSGQQKDFVHVSGVTPASIQMLRRLKNDTDGRAFAVVDVRARDIESAMTRARLVARGAVDRLNFFWDLIPYNHGWLYLPGEAESTQAIDFGRSSVGDGRVAYARVGPLLPFSIRQLRLDRRRAVEVRSLARLQKVDSPKSFASTLLTSFQWAGRATVEATREQAYLLYAIALEAAMLPVRTEGLTQKLADRVAATLGMSRDHRANIRKEVKILYGVRSRIVHSGSYEVTDKDLAQIREYAKRTLLLLLRRRVLWGLSAGEYDSWLERLSAK